MVKSVALRMALIGGLGLGIASCHTTPGGQASGPDANIGRRLEPTMTCRLRLHPADPPLPC